MNENELEAESPPEPPDPVATRAEPAPARAADVLVGGPLPLAWLDLCPYLLDATGEWRATAPTPEHRCSAVEPWAPVTTETQRSLCLVAAHVDCPLYRRAQEARARDFGALTRPRDGRPIARTAAVILERPSGWALLSARLVESLPQIGLLALIALAAAAVILARVIAP
jgi:hypothetical protein